MPVIPASNPAAHCRPPNSKHRSSTVASTIALTRRTTCPGVRRRQLTTGSTTDAEPGPWHHWATCPGSTAQHGKDSPSSGGEKTRSISITGRSRTTAPPQTPTIAMAIQALADTWGQKVHRSADEPEALPIFSTTEIRFNAPESGADGFR